MCKPPIFESIPAELQELPQWLMWKYVTKPDGKVSKIPYAHDGRHGSSTNPDTWTTFGVVQTRYALGGFDGIGFVFSPTDPYFGIDLDACRNPETGELTDWAREIVEQFSTYTEVSPSGYGLKLIGRGEIPDGKGREPELTGVPSFGDKKPEIAVFDRARYWCMTGDVL